MTLKEKYINLFPHQTEEYLSHEEAEVCEQIADNYAIEFAEWLYRYDNTRLPNGNWIIKLGLKPYTSKELLEIFKKEKGL